MANLEQLTKNSKFKNVKNRKKLASTPISVILDEAIYENKKTDNKLQTKSDKVTTNTQKTSKKLETNLKQIGKIKRTNGRQMDDKIDYIKRTNRRQIDDSITDFSSNRLHQADK